MFTFIAGALLFVLFYVLLLSSTTVSRDALIVSFPFLGDLYKARTVRGRRFIGDIVDDNPRGMYYTPSGNVPEPADLDRWLMNALGEMETYMTGSFILRRLFGQTP